MAYGVSNPQAFEAWQALSNANRAAQGANQFRTGLMMPLVQQQAMADAYRQGGLSGLLSMGAFQPAANLLSAQGRQQAGQAALQEAQSEAEWNRFAMGAGQPGGMPGAPAGAAVAGAGGGGWQPAQPLALEYAAALRSGDSTKMRAAREAIELGRVEGWSPAAQLEYFERKDPTRAAQIRKNMGLGDWEGARNLGSQRRPAADLADASLSAYMRLSSVDVNRPEEVLYATQIMVNQLLQPNNAVLLSEARESIRGLDSMIGRFGKYVQGVWQPTADLDATGLATLRDMGLQIGEVSLRKFKDQQEGWAAQQSVYDFSDAQDLTARPGNELIPIIDRALAAPKSQPTRLPEFQSHPEFGQIAKGSDGQYWTREEILEMTQEERGRLGF